MELKATALGKHLAQHPYDRVEILAAGVRVSGERHEYVIPFNQLLAIHCKRGLVWGEMEFVLADDQVVRLHGTQWQETQRFWQRLSALWAAWSQRMSEVAAGVLQEQWRDIQQHSTGERWLSYRGADQLRQQLLNAFAALPLPVARLAEFANCFASWQQCQHWLQHREACRFQNNQRWTDAMRQQHADFFASIEQAPLNTSQINALINGEESVLVLAGAGAGKTAMLAARAGWLSRYQQAMPEQILLLSFSRDAAQQLERRVKQHLPGDAISVNTFPSLALQIVRQVGKKTPKISQLEQDQPARYALLIACWQQQCASKKSAANGWHRLLQAMAAPASDAINFWQDQAVMDWLAPRLDDWLRLIRQHGGGQKHLLASAADGARDAFAKHLALLMPVHKAWKAALKEEGATDFYALLQQAIALLQHGRFISPWKFILLDEFQDISPPCAALLCAFRQQNSRTRFFAVGDDWQAIYPFAGTAGQVIEAFKRYFGAGDICLLDSSYRFGATIARISSAFIRQNPQQQQKPLHCAQTDEKKSADEKKAITLLPQEQLAPLLDKLSGFARQQQRILLLARYAHLRPDLLDIAATRWPGLQVEFMTIHASKGQQADYCIVIGLNSGANGFPCPATPCIIEQGLLADDADAFPDARERRLLYVALTRARQRVWLLYDRQQPSPFVSELKQLGATVARKP